MTDAEITAKVDEHLRVLAEHFGDIQFLGSWVDDDGNTHCLRRGVGNWYARQGMASEFISQDKANDMSLAIASKLNPDTDEGDEWKK